MTKPRNHEDGLDNEDEIKEMDWVILTNIQAHHENLGPISELTRLFPTQILHYKASLSWIKFFLY